MARRSINFLIGDVADSDRDLFFGPILPMDEWVSLSRGATWADAFTEAKLFPSRTQARKNGWGGPIMPGFSMFEFGKLRHEIAALKIV